jgi:hypothetical protein
MRSWIKFVAVFILAFMMFDVCSPERCEAQPLAPTPSSIQIHAQQNAGSSGDSCQFEEDCFNCAHYAPGSSVLLESSEIIAFTHPDLFVPPLDGSPLLPYHPPRA